MVPGIGRISRGYLISWPRVVRGEGLFFCGVYCVLSLRLIEFHRDVYFPVLFSVIFSTLAKRLARKTTLMIFFVLNGFPYKDQLEELFIDAVLFHIFPARNIFSFLTNFKSRCQSINPERISSY